MSLLISLHVFNCYFQTLKLRHYVTHMCGSYFQYAYVHEVFCRHAHNLNNLKDTRRIVWETSDMGCLIF